MELKNFLMVVDDASNAVAYSVDTVLVACNPSICTQLGGEAFGKSTGTPLLHRKRPEPSETFPSNFMTTKQRT
jgi:hypothetical protein